MSRPRIHSLTHDDNVAEDPLRDPVEAPRRARDRLHDPPLPPERAAGARGDPATVEEAGFGANTKCQTSSGSPDKQAADDARVLRETGGEAAWSGIHRLHRDALAERRGAGVVRTVGRARDEVTGDVADEVLRTVVPRRGDRFRDEEDARGVHAPDGRSPDEIGQRGALENASWSRDTSTSVTRPAEEELHPLPAPLAELSLVKEVRGTTLVSSLRGVRDGGHFGAYLANLLPEYREVIPLVVAGEWVPIDVALAHYRACDALGLLPNGGRPHGDRHSAATERELRRHREEDREGVGRHALDRAFASAAHLRGELPGRWRDARSSSWDRKKRAPSSRRSPRSALPGRDSGGAAFSRRTWSTSASVVTSPRCTRRRRAQPSVWPGSDPTYSLRANTRCRHSVVLHGTPSSKAGLVRSGSR